MTGKERIIKLRGIRNLRTLAGITTQDKRVIKADILLRSASLDKVTPKVFEILKTKYKLKKVIDLRTNDEVTKKPDVMHDGIEYHHMPVCADEIPGVSREIEPGKDSGLDLLPNLSDVYTAVIQGQEYVENIAQALREIMNTNNGAVLWHCTAGKDRCGFVSVFILYMLGVDMETIKEDYLLTNLDAIKDARKYYWLVRIFKRNREMANKVYAIYMADLEYLNAALNYIDTRGGMDKFITDILGITTGEIENFKSRVLA